MTDLFGIQIDMLRAAELQFRLASAVRLAATDRRQPLDLPIVWTHGKHSVAFHEVALSPEGADFAAMCLQRSATYLMAVQIQEALTAWTNGSARQHADADIRCSFEIARLIRNGFAHHPMQPVWNIDPSCRDKVYSVGEIVCLNTLGLDGKPFDWQDYGGPLALLRLSEFVRTTILGDSGRFGSNREVELVPQPLVEYQQQGQLILKRLK